MRRRKKHSSGSAVVPRGRGRKQFFLYTIYIFFTLLVIIGVLWVIKYTPIFRVQEIDISGNSSIEDEEIITFLNSRVPRGGFFGHMLGRDNILAWPQGFSVDDMGFMPKARTISLEKNYGEHKINIEVEERDEEGIWCAVVKSRCGWFDKDGIIFMRATPSEGSLVPTIFDHFSTAVADLGTLPISKEKFANLVSVFSVLRESEIFPAEIRVGEKDLDEIRVTLRDGPDLYFSLLFPSPNTLTAIQSLREKGEFQELEYIDFRVENRAYYQ